MLILLREREREREPRALSDWVVNLVVSSSCVPLYGLLSRLVVPVVLCMLKYILIVL